MSNCFESWFWVPCWLRQCDGSGKHRVQSYNTWISGPVSPLTSFIRPGASHLTPRKVISFVKWYPAGFLRESNKIITGNTLELDAILNELLGVRASALSLCGAHSTSGGRYAWDAELGTQAQHRCGVMQTQSWRRCETSQCEGTMGRGPLQAHRWLLVFRDPM